MPRRRSVSLAVAASMLLAGCGALPLGGDQALDELVAQIRALQGGECYRDKDGMVDFTHPVACTEEHAYEVLLAVPVPAEFGVVTIEDAVDVGGDVNTRLMDYTLPLCSAELARASGVVDAVSGVPGLADAYLWPIMPGTITAQAPPDAVWAEYPVMICMYGWLDDPTVATPRVTSTSADPVVASFGSTDAGDAVRTCFAATSGYELVPCSEPHDAEALFQFDAEVALGADWVGGVDPLALDDEQYAALDGICGAAAPAVFGAERTQQDVSVLGEVIRDAWGTPSAGSGSYPVMCVAYPADRGQRLAGPVWGIGDAPATLVPAA